MNGRERVKAALKLQEVDRTPWVPFVGCHGGALVQATAQEFLCSEDKLVAGVEAGIKRYQPDGVPVAFDLQMEAETFGCELAWAKENPPSVATHPLELGKKLSDFKIPNPKAGRIGQALRATRRLRAAHPDIALYGLITGPFTLALHLRGTNIFTDMFDKPEEVHTLLKFCREVAEAMAGYYIAAGCDVVAVVDPMTSQVGPEQFREFVTPSMKPVFDSVRKQGVLSSLFVCGHAQQNVEAMCECKPDNISVDENIPLDYVRDLCLKRNISFGGNLQLTTVLLLGTPQDAQRNALECLTIGGEKGFVLAPGCDLPYATPPANLEAVAKVVLDPYEREIARNMARSETTGEQLDMSEYGHSDKVIIDVITLDSEGCAPCQYMVEAVKAASPEFEGILVWREHKIKHREALVFMTSLMVKNIPTICIDGKITFVSRIPSRSELIAAIQKRILEKLRIKIRSRRAALYILGDGGEQCQTIQANIQRAVQELGAEVDVEMVSDKEKIAGFGVIPAQTPAVVLGRYQVKSSKNTPELTIIKEWIKDLL